MEKKVKHKITKEKKFAFKIFYITKIDQEV